jgi:hypothetical protein
VPAGDRSFPATVQSPVLGQESTGAAEKESDPLSFSLRNAGSSWAVPQVPLVSLATNSVVSSTMPAAAQSPGAEHDTELASAYRSWLSAPVPGICLGALHVPLTSLMSKAS